MGQVAELSRHSLIVTDSPASAHMSERSATVNRLVHGQRASLPGHETHETVIAPANLCRATYSMRFVWYICQMPCGRISQLANANAYTSTRSSRSSRQHAVTKTAVGLTRQLCCDARHTHCPAYTIRFPSRRHATQVLVVTLAISGTWCEWEHIRYGLVLWESIDSTQLQARFKSNQRALGERRDVEPGRLCIGARLRYGALAQIH